RRGTAAERERHHDSRECKHTPGRDRGDEECGDPIRRCSWCFHRTTPLGASPSRPRIRGPLAGAPLAGAPFAGTPLTSSPLAGAPLAGVPGTSSPFTGAPLAGEPAKTDSRVSEPLEVPALHPWEARLRTVAKLVRDVGQARRRAGA